MKVRKTQQNLERIELLQKFVSPYAKLTEKTLGRATGVACSIHWYALDNLSLTKPWNLAKNISKLALVTVIMQDYRRWIPSILDCVC